MRIIDKNTDFYDYCQNVYPDDLNTFDRRDSYNLSKEEFAHCFEVDLWQRSTKFAHKINDIQNPILLQVCNTFWFFLLTITKFDEYGYCTEYDLRLLDKWKDYGIDRKLIKLSRPFFKYTTIGSRDDYSESSVIERAKRDIHTNDLRKEKCFNKFEIFTSHGSGYKDKCIRTIPILKNIGIASIVDPTEIYFAIDEYFSKEKTESERDSSVGITDKEKVVNHGFDVKKSFRGKHKN